MVRSKHFIDSCKYSCKLSSWNNSFCGYGKKQWGILNDFCIILLEAEWLFSYSYLFPQILSRLSEIFILRNVACDHNSNRSWRTVEVLIALLLKQSSVSQQFHFFPEQNSSEIWENDCFLKTFLYSNRIILKENWIVNQLFVKSWAPLYIWDLRKLFKRVLENVLCIVHHLKRVDFFLIVLFFYLRSLPIFWFFLAKLLPKFKKSNFWENHSIKPLRKYLFIVML